MAVADLNVEFREEVGHQKVKAIRRIGKLPANYYAPKEDSVNLTIDMKTFIRILNTGVHVLNVTFPDKSTHQCIVREIQRDPVTDEIVHADFMGIKLDEIVRLTIPIILVGTPEGVKEGGILEHLIREVEVEGLPLEIPDHVSVDVSALNIGDNVILEDVEIEKCRFVTDLRHGVAHVVHPKVVEEVEEVEEGDELGEEEAAEGEEGAAESEE